MEMRSESRQFGWVFRLASAWFAGAMLLAVIAPSWVFAQSSNDFWSDPVNLSHTGFAINPAFVIDSAGVGHAIWQNDIGNFVYTRLENDQWSTPATTSLNSVFRLPAPGEAAGPQAVAAYEGPNPLFIAGPNGYIYAFWVAQENLYASRVNGSVFEKATMWDSARLIAPTVSSFAVAVDLHSELHLAYLTTAEDSDSPAGVYYRRSKSGSGWGAPILLYESSYFRTLGEGEASLSVAATVTEDATRVYVVWDNRPRKQVLLTQSADGGGTWEEPALIAGPAPDTGADGPFNIRVGTQQNNVALVWQSGQPGGGCSQLSQFSSDAGATWSDPEVMIDNLLGCEQSNYFLLKGTDSADGPSYFMTETKNQTFLSVWNGLQWSQPQVQPILSGFKEPEIYTEVIYACHYVALSGDQLYVVGCDQGEGGDIWATSRDLGSDTSGLKPPVWGPLSSFTTGNLKVEAVELVTTDDGLVHSVLSQHQDSSIYYSNWNGELWSRLTPVLKLPDGEAGWPAIAAGRGNELFLIVPNNQGALYFSRAVSGGAVMASSWSKPTALEIGHDGKIGSVDVSRNADGTLYVAYSIPVNEERGVYLILSKDEGATWSEPVKLFDGTAAGFDFVGAPSLLASADGSLHVMWNVHSIQGDGSPQPVSLFYTRSDDGGHIFSDAHLIVEEPVVWRELMTDGKGGLHLLWQPQGALTTVWDQVSLDGGHTWEYPYGLPVEGKLVAAASDPAGRLHLLDAGPGALGHWHWNGTGWKSESPLNLPLTSQQENSAELLAAIINKQGKMIVVLAKPISEGDRAEMSLLYSTRTLELPRILPEIQNVPTKISLAPTSVPNTPTPGNLPTEASTLESQPTASLVPTESNESNNRISPFTIALVPVALLLLGVLGIVIRQVVRAKDR